MGNATRILAGGLIGALALGMGGCSSDDVSGPEMGSLEVLLTMEGPDQDQNGGTLVLDGETLGPIGVNVRRTETVEAGIYIVMITGISPNCSPIGTNERNVTIRDGEVAEEVFSFLCESIGGKDPGGDPID